MRLFTVTEGTLCLESDGWEEDWKPLHSFQAFILPYTPFPFTDTFRKLFSDGSLFGMMNIVPLIICSLVG